MENIYDAASAVAVAQTIARTVYKENLFELWTSTVSEIQKVTCTREKEATQENVRLLLQTDVVVLDCVRDSKVCVFLLDGLIIYF